MRATKVNAGLAESNGRLLLSIWRDSLHVTCGLTACTPGSAPGPTLGNEYGKTLPFLPFILRLPLPYIYLYTRPVGSRRWGHGSTKVGVEQAEVCHDSAAASYRSISAARARAQQLIRRTALLLSIDGTDGRTPDRYIDPAPHTTRAASTSYCEVFNQQLLWGRSSRE